MPILVINAGSSSLKFGLFLPDSNTALASGLVDWAGRHDEATLRISQPGKDVESTKLDVPDHRTAFAHAVQALREQGFIQDTAREIAGVGHRVVHGGTAFQHSVRIDGEVKAEIDRLSTLAPLHNPPALQGILAAEAALPDVPQVAVFDTAYYADLPAAAHVYPLPYRWYAEWGIRRFGFHGISHAYCANRAAEMLGDTTGQLRVISLHLGNGASATASGGGKAVATTMGFTPIAGLMMGTRPGTIDPGILLHVQRAHGLTVDDIDRALNRESGLLGVSGVSSDFRHVEEAAEQGNERAKLALELFAARVKSTVGALTVTLGGVDALVFTAGIGTHATRLRETVCDGLECLGLHMDTRQNANCQPDMDIATENATGRILVIQTHEELMIARETLRCLEGA